MLSRTFSRTFTSLFLGGVLLASSATTVLAHEGKCEGPDLPNLSKYLYKEESCRDKQNPRVTFSYEAYRKGLLIDCGGTEGQKFLKLPDHHSPHCYAVAGKKVTLYYYSN